MILSLKVSPISYALLLAEYPSHERSGTIVVSSHSYLARLLVSRKMDSALATDHLTKVIHISIKKQVKLSEADMESISHILHEDARQTLMRWIQSSVAAGTTASYGIRSFMRHYDMDDDDLNQETTLRMWQRWVRRHTDLLEKPKEKILYPTVRTWDENRFAHFIAEIVEYLYSSSGRWSHHRLSALRLLAYNSQTSIQKKIDPLGYKENTAYVAINKTKKWIARHSVVSQAWDKWFGIKK